MVSKDPIFVDHTEYTRPNCYNVLRVLSGLAASQTVALMKRKRTEGTALQIIQSAYSRYVGSGISGEGGDPSGRRTLKACRSCRAQKLRCEAAHTGSADAPCERCATNGVECLFELTAPRRGKRLAAHGQRPARREEPGAGSPRVSCRTPHPGSSTSPAGLPPSVSIVSRSPENGLDRRGLLSPASGVEPPHTSSEFFLGLTSQDLRAPVSAVHQMSTPEEHMATTTNSPAASTTRVTENQHNQSHKGGIDFLLGGSTNGPDIVTRGLVPEAQARNVFNLFMASAGNFLPIFDSVLDAFDSLRVREPFCFTVVLALANCIEPTPDLAEASLLLMREETKKGAAQSMFKKPATLGDVQAMLLLAAYAEEAWFAIGHALQMAKDLQLDMALQKLVTANPVSMTPSLKEQKRLVRQVRVWLAICFIEREIAAGTATASRLEAVDMDHLQRFRSHPLFRPADLRLASLVEIVQLRERFQQQIGLGVDNLSDALSRLTEIENEYRGWLDAWDNLHEEYGFETQSFQRASLRGQKNYAVMFTGCTILGRLQKELGVTSLSSGPLDGPVAELVKYLVATSLKQLRHVVHMSAYRWHLRWATNYTALSVTFAVVFVLNVARLQKNFVDRTEVFHLAEEIAQALQPCPHPRFHRLVCLAIMLAANQPPSPTAPALPSPGHRDGHNSTTDSNSGSVAILHGTPLNPRVRTRRASPRTTAPTICEDQHSEEIRPPSQQEQQQDCPSGQLPPNELSLEALLNDHLQEADWMIEPSSIASINFPGEAAASLFPHDLPMGNDHRLTTFFGD
ncbi:Zn(2)-C6 fungal-type DNA-binding domain protein [Niveomyces insectorum RCEF 264]|uniref:Zn(2)-C6 fungal-type DNA-binding domain protein n=1 Tax=Niveomyces insectorum RCEF 264 TaxID=1081102 RepID=A0A162IAA4_9HYPO|nr:Zn(2)-C6 fungal-type DNA-binding domain protein [Niveomyces insectorum RCEF 264]